MSRRVSLVLNQRAAEDELLREAVRLGRGEGLTITVRVCWEDGDGIRWTREAAERGADLIVAAGGDGTLNEAANGLLDLDEDGPPLGFLPFGTANDFAAGLEIGRVDPLSGLENMLDADPVRVDAGRVNGRWFVNVATGGFGAQVTARTAPGLKRLLGGAAYLVSGLGEMSHMSARTLGVRGPGWGWEGEAYLVAVGNGRKAGGGFLVCPDAAVDDGLLDVVVIPEVPDSELLRMLGGLIRSGGHLESDSVWTRQGTWVELESEQEMQLNLDGEPVWGRSFRFEVAPGCLRMVFPEEPLSSMLTREQA